MPFCVSVLMAGFTKSKLHILSLLSSRGLWASAQPQKFETITVSNGYSVGQMLAGASSWNQP